jgi:hypothetical protein
LASQSSHGFKTDYEIFIFAQLIAAELLIVNNIEIGRFVNFIPIETGRFVIFRQTLEAINSRGIMK